MGDLMALVVKAHLGRAWLALGYESWPDYIKGEFNHAPLSLPREERKAVVALLRGQGMSTRAIGPAIGVTDRTVANDLAGAKFFAPDELAPVIGLDGKKYKRKPPSYPKSNMDEADCSGRGDGFMTTLKIVDRTLKNLNYRLTTEQLAEILRVLDKHMNKVVRMLEAEGINVGPRGS
jgi:transposase